MSGLFFYYFTFVILSILAGIVENIRRNRNNESVFFEFEKRPQTNIRTEARLNALNSAKAFLSPYKNIWKNLRLSNKHCSLKLSEDGSVIIGKEYSGSNKPYYRMCVATLDKNTTEVLWNLCCLTFNNSTNYDILIETLKEYRPKFSETKKKNDNYINKNSISYEKIDINNCSEIEMTKLPGISIVLSKKAIKKREEIGGFKSIEDFFIYLKIKPHFREQLKDLICINEPQGYINKILNEERSVDL